MAIIKKVYNETNAGESVEKKEPSYTVGENANWCSDHGELCESSLKKLKGHRFNPWPRSVG